MSGWMEFTVLSDETVRQAIVPTVVLPFALLGVLLSSVATSVAALFGVKLKAEGPKKLLELLLKPRILASALILNALLWGGYRFYESDLKWRSWPATVIRWINLGTPGSALAYGDRVAGVQDFSGEHAEFLGDFELQWKTHVKGAVFGGVAVSGDSLFVGTLKGEVSEIDLRTGEKRRSFLIGQAVTPKPALWNGRLYFGEGLHPTHGAKVYAFDLASGQLQASSESFGHIEREIVAYHDSQGRRLVMFPGGSEGLIAADADSLHTLWSQKLGHVDTSPVLADGIAYFGTGNDEEGTFKDSFVAAVDPRTGQLLWSRKVAMSAFGMPVVWKDQVCFGLGNIYPDIDKGEIACFARASGELTQSYPIKGSVVGKPWIRENLLTVVSLQGVVMRVDLEAKKRLWSFETPAQGWNYSSVIVDSQDRIILPTDEGLEIYPADVRKRLAIWRPPVEDWKGSFVNVERLPDRWIFADKHGWIYSLKPVSFRSK